MEDIYKILYMYSTTIFFCLGISVEHKMENTNFMKSFLFSGSMDEFLDSAGKHHYLLATFSSYLTAYI